MMRREELAVYNPEKIDDIIQNCDCVRIAFADGNKPYIVPVSFGYRRENGTPVFYIHGAKEGKKVDLIKKLGYVAFELDTDRKLKISEQASGYSFQYRSVLGEGDIKELTGLEEKEEGLQVIMKQYRERDDWDIPDSVIENTMICRLTVREMTGRKHD